MPSKIILRLLVFILLLFGLTACLSLAEDITPPPGYQAPTAVQNTPTSPAPVYPVLPPDPERGAVLYTEKCAPCHGTAGLGDGPDAGMLANPVAPLGDPALARTADPASWYQMVTNGNMQNFMPPFSSLSVPERWDVIAYAYTLSTTPEEVMRGQELYAENCVACHGERGKGDGPDAGALSTSPINFTDQEFMGTRSAANLFDSITNGLGEMHSFANLAEDDRWALTAFLRTLTFAETGTAATPENGVAEIPEEQATPESTLTPDELATEAPSEGQVESGIGTVNVKVNPTSGVALPANMEVTVYSFEGMTQVYSNTIPLSDDGRVVLDDVPMPSDQFIFATLEYDGIVYGSDIAVVEPEMTAIDLEIPFYEHTSDLGVLQADRLHIFFDFVNEGTVQVYVLYIFSNGSDQVLAADNAQDPAVIFELPEGATNLQRDIGMELQAIDLPNGFGLTSVFPSTDPYQVLYSFDMPYVKDKVDFDLDISMDTTAVIVMAPESGVKVKSDQLTDAGMRDIEGISYNIYNGNSMQIGDLLNMVVSGQPKASPISSDSNGGDTSTGLVIGLVAFGIVLIGAGLYLWRRNRAQEDDTEDAELLLGNNQLDESPEDLMDAIIALDELHQAGEIPENAYQKRRAELKARLQELMEG